jgi:copper(I)-binding protein
MKILRFSLCAAALFSFGFAEADPGPPAADITIVSGNVYQSTKTGTDVIGFAQIGNTGNAADTLTGWSCTIAASMMLVDAKGNPLTSLPIPAGHTTSMSAGGVHFILHDIHYPVEYGSVLPCSLTFQSSGLVEAYLFAEPAPGS